MQVILVRCVARSSLKNTFGFSSESHTAMAVPKWEKINLYSSRRRLVNTIAREINPVATAIDNVIIAITA